MPRPLLVSLYDFSGEWARPWVSTHDVILVDVQFPGRSWIKIDGRDVLCLGMDVRDFVTDWRGYIADACPKLAGRAVDVVLAAPPCRVFCRPGARLWKQWDADGQTADELSLVDAVLDFVKIVKPRVWALENPPGFARAFQQANKRN